jgi:hypothetical protein
MDTAPCHRLMGYLLIGFSIALWWRISGNLLLKIAPVNPHVGESKRFLSSLLRAGAQLSYPSHLYLTNCLKIKGKVAVQFPVDLVEQCGR